MAYIWKKFPTKMNHNLWIALDAAGTLFEPTEPVAKIYADCFAQHGHTASEDEWNKSFKTAFSQTPDPIYLAPGDGEAEEKEWWKSVVTNSAKATGFDPTNPAFEEIFDQLFNHYAAGSAWKLFPETKSVLTTFRDLGVKMAVVSNFDSRIHQVLEELEISHLFEFTLTSADVAARKPDPAILLKMLKISGANPSNCCLVGDSLTADGGAANAAGIPFFHINRPDQNFTHFENWYSSRFFRK